MKAFFWWLDAFLWLALAVITGWLEDLFSGLNTFTSIQGRASLKRWNEVVKAHKEEPKKS